MSASDYKYVSYGHRGYGDRIAVVGRAVAYLGVPASLATGPVFTSVTILTSLYLVAAVGFVAAIRETRFPSGLLALGYLLLACYLVLLGLDLLHGGPGSYPLFGTNYLLNYFVLLAFPFFALGLRTLKADVRMFEYAMMATVVFAALVSLYQFLILQDPRPMGFNSNPIPFGLIVTMWCLFLLSRALVSERIDRTKAGVALVGLVPIVLSGSKLVWACAFLGYAILIVWWARSNRQWRALGIVAVAVLIGFSLLYQLEAVHGRVVVFVQELAATFGSGDTSGASLGLRVAAAFAGWIAFLHRPFTGYGLPQVKAAALEYRTAGSGDFALLSHLHNEYVTHLVAFGFLGIVFMALLLVAFFAVARRVSDVGVRRFAIVAGAMFMVYMAGEVVLRDGELYGLFFFIFGLAFLCVDRDEVALPAWLAAGSASVSSTASTGQRSPRSLPPVPVMVLLGATVIGAALFVWAQRDSFVLVGQKGILFEPPRAGDSVTNEVDASVAWREADGPDGARIVADIDVPETGQRITLTFRKNTDAAFPASHVIEVAIGPQRNFPDKMITDVGTLIAKGNPGEAGLPLTADTAQIGDGLFWTGLSPDDVAGNQHLLDASAFFDLPLTYASGQESKLTFEKGRTGRAVFQKVMSRW